MEGIMEEITAISAILSIVTVVASLGGSYFLINWRLKALEDGREKDAEKFQSTLNETNDDIQDAIKEGRKERGSMWQRIDETVQAGSVLENRVSSVEAILDPERVHHFNKWLGGFEQKTETRVSRNEHDIRRLEDIMLQHIQYDAERR